METCLKSPLLADLDPDQNRPGVNAVGTRPDPAPLRPDDLARLAVKSRNGGVTRKMTGGSVKAAGERRSVNGTNGKGRGKRKRTGRDRGGSGKMGLYLQVWDPADGETKKRADIDAYNYRFYNGDRCPSWTSSSRICLTVATAISAILRIWVGVEMACGASMRQSPSPSIRRAGMPRETIPSSSAMACMRCAIRGANDCWLGHLTSIAHSKPMPRTSTTKPPRLSWAYKSRLLSSVQLTM